MIQLSEKEYNMIDIWRSNHTMSDIVPSQELLVPWSENKEKFLYKMMGEELILKRENLTFQKPKVVLEEEFQDFPEINRFLRALRSALCERFQCKFTFLLPTKITPFFESQAILTNHYDGPTVVIPELNDLKINHNEKTMRILRKIIHELGDPLELTNLYEPFRLAVSQILNNNKITGTLCLSIHPLDYMTMSDNTYDWDSCMNWEDGCYRLGTTEMLNSPCVVIAYLLGEKDNFYVTNKETWSNKRWRCLFVVDKGIIASIKGYPYRQPDICQYVVNWIADLATKNLGWHYDEHMFIKKDNKIVDEKNVYAHVIFNPLADYMYNDFNRAEHYIRLSQMLMGPYYGDTTVPDYYIELNYSGPYQCMTCGELKFDNDGQANTLECNSCANYRIVGYCNCCGGRIYTDDDYYNFDDEIICHTCYEENYTYCSRCTRSYRYNRSPRCCLIGIENFNRNIYHDDNNDPFLYYYDNHEHNTDFAVQDICPQCFENLSHNHRGYYRLQNSDTLTLFTDFSNIEDDDYGWVRDYYREDQIPLYLV